MTNVRVLLKMLETWKDSAKLVLRSDLSGCVSNTLALVFINTHKHMVIYTLLRPQNTNGSIITVARPAFLSVNWCGLTPPPVTLTSQPHSPLLILTPQFPINPETSCSNGLKRTFSVHLRSCLHSIGRIFFILNSYSLLKK